MLRRLSNLRQRRGYATFMEYERAMVRDKALLDEFMNHITINVSEFFRNAVWWDLLQKKVFSDLATQTRAIKCWSAACSTGEEPYSLAMQLLGMASFRDIDVLASDIDDNALNKARLGQYPDSALKSVPAPMLKRYFDAGQQTYTVKQEVKQHVRFAKHNLLADPFQQGYHLIVCRNVLIYFTDSAKDLLMQRFSNALRVGGYLFLGGTEHIKDPSKYKLESVETFFYRRLG